MVSSSATESPKPKGEEYVLKFVLCGDASVGKSQLVMRFSRDEFSQDSPQTIGMEFATRELAYYEHARLKAQIWDTAGQERFHRCVMLQVFAESHHEQQASELVN
jgi:small GTP-binding protein